MEEKIMKGILGKKVGMTQVFTKDGKLIPVTVIEVEPNVVTQIKTVEKDGYDAIQLGTDTKREKVSTKAEVGHAKKANTTPNSSASTSSPHDVSASAVSCGVRLKSTYSLSHL